jgi:hypothetical protein
MYTSILSVETINKLKLFFDCGIPGLKMWDTFACANFLTHFIISIAVLEKVPSDAGLQKRATFFTLNVGLAGTGKRTRAICFAKAAALTAQPTTTPLPTHLLGLGVPRVAPSSQMTGLFGIVTTILGSSLKSASIVLLRSHNMEGEVIPLSKLSHAPRESCRRNSTGDSRLSLIAFIVRMKLQFPTSHNQVAISAWSRVVRTSIKGHRLFCQAEIVLSTAPHARTCPFVGYLLN